MKQNKAHYLSASLILLVTCFLSIGFSTFQYPLLIDGVNLEVRLEENIRVTGIQVYNSELNAISNYEDYNVHNLITGITLPNSNSTITYKVEITNFGNIEMGIFDITGLPSNLTYELKEYTLKEKICDSSKNCTLGAKKEFYITIKYAPGKYDSTKLTYDLNLNIDFRGFHKITYINIENTDNYPKEVMNGANFQTVFESDIPVKVLITGNSNYTYNTNTLLVNNVTEDIIVDRMYRFYEKVLVDNKNILNVGCPTKVGDYTRLDQMETGKKFCTAPDNYGTSYYFRGSSENNYVKFAGYYWRIIRINGDNTVRMIYAGTTPVENGVPNTTTIIGNSTFNNNPKDNTSVGYMIGTIEATNYASAHSNSTDSVLKQTIDNWYRGSSLTSASNSKYLADNLFCNDRSLYSQTDISSVLGISKHSMDKETGYGTNITYYAGFYRIIVSAESGKNTGVFQSYASLKCLNKNDSFTQSDAVNGNAKLKYPVATITADELILAGILNTTRYIGVDSQGLDTFENPQNREFYLYNGQSLMTMTPSSQPTYFGAHAMIGTGWISGGGLTTSSRSVRPVINIKADTLIKSGNGTINNPYIFE